MSCFSQRPMSPMRKDIPGVQRWCNHHKCWHCTKSHVLKLGSQRRNQEWPFWAMPGDCCSALPGLREDPTFPHLRATACQPARSESSRHPPHNPTSRASPSASVSVLPSSSRKGVSCSRVRRKENTSAEKYGSNLMNVCFKSST